MLWVIFLVGLFVGANVGVVVSALCFSLKRDAKMNSSIAMAEEFSKQGQTVECSTCIHRTESPQAAHPVFANQ